MAIDIGRIAYEGYCKFRKERFFDYQIAWEHLTQEEQDMYRYMGSEVLCYAAELEEMRKRNPDAIC